mgnify:CR=1 FL=1
MGPRSRDRGRLVADRVRQLPHLASMGPRTNDPATESEDLRQRFEREVKAAARLEHRRRVGIRAAGGESRKVSVLQRSPDQRRVLRIIFRRCVYKIPFAGADPNDCPLTGPQFQPVRVSLPA